MGLFILFTIIGAIAGGSSSDDTTQLTASPTVTSPPAPTAMPEEASATTGQDTTASTAPPPSIAEDKPPTATAATPEGPCANQEARNYILGRNETIQNAIIYLDELETALWELKAYPATGRDEMWGARVDAHARSLDQAGSQLVSNENVPEGNKEIQESYEKVGGAMIDVASTMHSTWMDARVVNSRGEPGPWEKSASRAEDALDEAADAIEDNLELIAEICDL